MPSNVKDFPLIFRAITVLNCAERSDMSFNSDNNNFIFDSEHFSGPAYLAERIPGEPFNALTFRPVSSAKQSKP